MLLLRKFRFSMATVMMVVVTAAVASALFARVRVHVPAASMPYFKVDAPVLFVLAIVLTAVALGALKAHTPGQTMLQVVLACLGFLALITMAENGWLRPLLYWFQGCFALMVAGPMVARRVAKSDLERGPRRSWWKRTLEAPVFAFLTMMLVLFGAFIQWITAMVGGQVFKF